ncbi:MAG TPA: type II secretion system protein GspJ [Geobacteraceae bacterium]
MSRNRGFTLLELLVALALLALLAATLYGTYFGLMAGRDRATAVTEEMRELRTTLDSLRREIAAAYYRQASDPTKPRFRFVVEDRDFFGKPASTLVFTAIAPPAVGETQPVSDQALVEYRPVAKENAMRLMRRRQDVYLENDTYPTYTQMEEMQGFLVECSNDGAQWTRTWDSRLNSPPLPQWVRVTITVKDGEKNVPYVAVINPRMQP